jgi:hypothetical protein
MYDDSRENIKKEDGEEEKEVKNSTFMLFL